MEALEAILTRRSVRHYTSEPVNPEHVETLLRAAMSAPSSANGQPWQFVVIRDPSILEAVTGFHPYSQMLHEASLAILVCGCEQTVRAPSRWMLDCAAATENLLLAAHAIGLGAVWMAIWPDPVRVEKMAQLVGLPANILPLALVPVGHPAEIPLPADRFDPARVHENHW